MNELFVAVIRYALAHGWERTGDSSEIGLWCPWIGWQYRVRWSRVPGGIDPWDDGMYIRVYSHYEPQDTTVESKFIADDGQHAVDILSAMTKMDIPYATREPK